MAGGVADALRGKSDTSAAPTVEGSATPTGVALSLLACALFFATGGPARVATALIRRRAICTPCFARRRTSPTASPSPWRSARRCWPRPWWSRSPARSSLVRRRRLSYTCSSLRCARSRSSASSPRLHQDERGARGGRGAREAMSFRGQLRGGGGSRSGSPPRRRGRVGQRRAVADGGALRRRRQDPRVGAHREPDDERLAERVAEADLHAGGEPLGALVDLGGA